LITILDYIFRILEIVFNATIFSGISYDAVISRRGFLIGLRGVEFLSHNALANEHFAGADGAGLISVRRTAAVDTPRVLVALGRVGRKVDALAEHVSTTGKADSESLVGDFPSKWASMECFPDFRFAADLLFNSHPLGVEPLLYLRIANSIDLK